MLFKLLTPQTDLQYQYQERLLVATQILLQESRKFFKEFGHSVENAAILHRKQVGLTIVYGRVPDPTFISQAQQVAQKIYSILGSINQRGFNAFAQSAFYKPLYTLSNTVTENEVQVDV